MWNDKETDVDLLGHITIAQTVLEIIGENHLRPLTLGIYGDWGAGKSTVLSLLQKEINSKSAAKEISAHTISFNGWLFQGYEDAKTALMETIVTELAKLQPGHKKVQKLAKSLLQRVNWLKVAKVSANALLTGVTGIPMNPLLNAASAIVDKGKEILGSESKGDDTKPFEVGDDENFLKEAEEKTVTGQISSFRKEFKELIVESKVDQIVILVDDLDRCLPKSVIEILEAIRLFLFVEGTTFIISADEKMIEYAVREHFPNLPSSYSEYTKSYLEKLIQIPIRVPFLNQLQTGNYIKFLMLQNHLKNDFSELEKAYSGFLKTRKTPYDNTELNYEVLKSILDQDSDTLKETLFVADQLSPTLTVGLKGNPRNIKRFLNTLFLRMKISKIYGLEDEIKLNVLAKLMLLERFQPEKFDLITSEIVSSGNGTSETICEAEKDLNGTTAHKSETEAEIQNQKFHDWITLEPSFNGLDLKPYVFISKEKAIGLETQEKLPAHLSTLLEQLNSGSEMALNGAARTLPQLVLSDAVRLFEMLEGETRTISDLNQIPKPVKGLLRIVASHADLEERLLTLIASYPVKTLGVWAGSQLSGVKSLGGKQKLRELLLEWSKQTENQALRKYAIAALKN